MERPRLNVKMVKGMKQDVPTGFFDSYVDKSSFVPVDQGK
jgi:hypothetical protein